MKKIGKVIFGIEGIELTEQEKNFYAKVNPLGFILFRRNIESPTQIKALIEDLYLCTENPFLHILIDQEGGRVARLKPPYFRNARPAGDFAKLAEVNLPSAQEAVFLNHYLMGQELKELGINVNCAPMCDMLFSNSHNIIGDRSFGRSKKAVISLAKAAIEGLIHANVIPIIKHIPGHGRAQVDSHEDLPCITENLEELESSDFSVFKSLAFAPWAMTAHILYDSIDPYNCATLSPSVISYIREEIGFKNILISDDICMKALKGDLAKRAQKAIESGCDIVLHCQGSINDYQEVAEVCGFLDGHQIDLIKKAFNITKYTQDIETRYKLLIENKTNIELENKLEDFFN